MIPYFTLPTWEVASVPVDPWGLLVCIGFVLGLEIARARGIRLGLDVRDVVDGSVFIVLMAFLGGHLMYVLAYHPDRYARDGFMSLVRVWQGFASTGGFLGAVTGAVLFFRVLRPRPFWLHGDTIMFGFPFAWIFGRAGCALVHDHIGRPTTFPLAVDFSRVRLPLADGTTARGGVRHDLGLYETLWAVVIAGTFVLLARRPRPAGFFTMTWCLMYAPARFGMDFLRAVDLKGADVRWAGLTPAQWAMLAMFGAGIALWRRTRGAPPVEPALTERLEAPAGETPDAPAPQDPPAGSSAG